MRILRSAIVILIVFGLGLWFGPVVSTIGWENALRGIVEVAFRSGGLILIVVVALASIYAFRAQLSLLVFGRVRIRLEAVLSRIFDVVDLVVRAARTNSLRRQNAYGARARQHARTALEEFASAVLFTLGLRSLLGLLIGLMATFAATVGTYLLLNQNELLARQIQTLQDQALEDLYLETFDSLQQDRASSPRAEARATLFFSRVPSPERQASPPAISSQLDFRRCGNVKIQSVPDQVRGLLGLGLSPEVVPLRLIDMTDYRGAPEALQSAFADGDISRAIADDQVVSNGSRALGSGNTLSRVLSRGVAISFSSFSNITWRQMTIDRGLVQDSCFDGAQLASSYFPFTLMRNVTFVGANLSKGSFEQGQLVNVDFNNADLRGSAFANQLLKSIRFDGADMSFAHLGAENEEILLQDVTFQGTNLTGAVISALQNPREIDFETSCTHPWWPACVEQRGTLDLSSGGSRCDASETPAVLSDILDQYFDDREALQSHLTRYNACIRSVRQ